MNYYNEFDPNAAAWLRELIAQKLIPAGEVDERSITDVQATDLLGYTQCHFFAGIGGWSLALQLAGWPENKPVWTGSCPCQPYSAAGKGLGDEDPRNLWPAFFKLIRECRPVAVFGEQVAEAIGKGWLDRVSADLEGEGYACGSVVLGAHSVLAPHIRQRLYWVADSEDSDWWGEQPENSQRSGRSGSSGICPVGGLADSIGPQLQGHAGDERDGDKPGRIDEDAAGSTAAGGATGGGMANTPSLPRAQHVGEPGNGSRREKSPNDAAERGGDHGGMAEPNGGQCDGITDGQGRQQHGKAPGWQQGDSQPEPCGDIGGMVLTNSNGRQPRNESTTPARHGDSALTTGFWSDSRWIYCRDGKHRRIPTQPALFPLADGIPYKLARRGSIRPALLKGSGNAIVPQVAAQFIQAFMHTISQTANHPTTE